MGGDRINGVANDLHEIDVGEVEPKLAGGNASGVEQIVNQTLLRFGPLLDGGQAFLKLGGVFQRFGILQDLGPEQNAAEGRAKFVADGGEKFVLHAAGVFGGFLGGFERLLSCLAAGNVAEEDGDTLAVPHHQRGRRRHRAID